MIKIGINFDEISDDITVAVRLMHELGVKYGELRTINSKNFVFWDDSEWQAFNAYITSEKIELVGAATPLFKWYNSPKDPDVLHDSFGFDPRLSHKDKIKIISRTFKIANSLQIPRIRIFSALGECEDSGFHFANDPLLAKTLELAEKYSIDVLVENEPVCTIHTKNHIVDLLRNNTHPRLKFWLDIANLTELGESIDEAFVNIIANRIGYIHIKDYSTLDPKTYVPAGEGVIDYSSIMKLLRPQLNDDVVVTVETHAKIEKINSSKRALLGTIKIMEESYDRSY